jgi:hypothetical protein
VCDFNSGDSGAGVRFNAESFDEETFDDVKPDIKKQITSPAANFIVFPTI